MSGKKTRFAPKPAKSAGKAEPEDGKRTITAIAGKLGLSRKTLEGWRAQGCPGIPPADMDLAAIVAWAERNGKRAGAVGEQAAVGKEQKLFEEIRKLRLANDAKAGRLVDRAWIVECISRAAGELNAYRARSETEHPTRFAAAANDVAKCRTLVRAIWDEVFEALGRVGNVFEGGGPKL